MLGQWQPHPLLCIVYFDWGDAYVFVVWSCNQSLAMYVRVSVCEMCIHCLSATITAAIAHSVSCCVCVRRGCVSRTSVCLENSQINMSIVVIFKQIFELLLYVTLPYAHLPIVIVLQVTLWWECVL